MEKYLIIAFLAMGGLFCVLASIYNWDFFFNNRRARFFVSLIGRKGARIFYAILGLVLIVISIRGFFMPDFI